jgi:hypothetical protein
MGFHYVFYVCDVGSHRMCALFSLLRLYLLNHVSDDAAAHISEEISYAEKAAPLAMITGVLGTEILGFFLLIGASFASSSIPKIIDTDLSMPMGQVYLDTLGKKGMLAVWSLCIAVQVSQRNILPLKNDSHG